eukprot:137114-Prymnesium_polylepis.1
MEHTPHTPLMRARAAPPPSAAGSTTRIWDGKGEARTRGAEAGAGAGGEAGPPLALRPQGVVSDAVLGQGEGSGEANDGANTALRDPAEACTARGLLPGGFRGASAGRCGGRRARHGDRRPQADERDADALE